MPTRGDFEAAASSFSIAAEQVGALTVAVENIEAGDIIRGGSLAHQVPTRIAQASTAARTCQTLIEQAADTCRERAAIIADYELQLVSYDRAFAAYDQRSYSWNQRYYLWWSDPTSYVHPGAQPLPPPKPIAPPPWAEVRRP